MAVIGGMALVALVAGRPAGAADAEKPKAAAFWNVDDIKPGMKGIGKSVFKGTKIETFNVEVLGVLKKVTPRRDMVVARLSGPHVDLSGVQQGMSGSPIYIDGKLLGAVAYTWSFTKIPLAGITPITQMVAFYKDLELDQAPEKLASRTFKMDRPLVWKGKRYEQVRVDHEPARNQSAAAGMPTLTPIVTPIVASGLARSTVDHLNERWAKYGVRVVQGGAANAAAKEAAKGVKLEPGSVMGVAMMLGDIEMAGTGTVTYVDGDTIYGFGHSMYSKGKCEFPLTTGFVQTVIPSMQISSKMTTILDPAGTLRFDTDAAVIGKLGAAPPMVPVKVTVARGKGVPRRTYNMQIVRDKDFLPYMTFVALADSFANEGDLPEEITVKMRSTITFKKHHNPLVIDDVFAGSTVTGGMAPYRIFNEVLGAVSELVENPFEPVEIAGITCETQAYAGRRSAAIESMTLDEIEVEPGESVTARVVLKAWKGPRFVETITVPIPKDTEPGTHSITVSDARMYMSLIRGDKPHKYQPKNLSQVFDLLRIRAYNNRLYAHIPLERQGISIDSRELPDLPPSVLATLAGYRRTGMERTRESLRAEKQTDWVIQGAHRIPFNVVEEKRTQF